MKTLFIAIFVSVIFTISVEANNVPAIWTDGNNLKWWCLNSEKKIEERTPTESLQVTYCSGFIFGIRMGYIYGSKQLDCATKLDIKSKQIVSVIMKYLNEHPEKLHIQSTIIVMDAIEEAFCKKE